MGMGKAKIRRKATSSSSSDVIPFDENEIQYLRSELAALNTSFKKLTEFVQEGK